MTKTYLEKAAQLHTQAKKLLESDLILPVLEQKAEVILTGSYVLDLMVWPDLDIQINFKDNSDPIGQITQLADHFMRQPLVRDIKLINFHKAKRPGMPEGYYLGLDLMPIDDIKWKLDIWSLPEKEQVKNAELLKLIQSQLTPELRALILTLKYRLMGDANRMPKFGSYRIYQAVFVEGLKDEASILAYLAQKGFQILKS